MVTICPVRGKLLRGEIQLLLSTLRGIIAIGSRAILMTPAVEAEITGYLRDRVFIWVTNCSGKGWEFFLDLAAKRL